MTDPQHFPKTPDEAKQWTPYVRHTALAMRVITVAQQRIEGAWRAYIDAVPGQNHQLEFDAVLRNGEPLPEDVALALFPEFEGVPYAR